MLFFKQKTAYEMRISDWSSDVCSSDLIYKQNGRDWALVASRLEEVVAQLPQEVDAGVELGNAYLRLGRRDAAIGAYQRLLDQDKVPVEEKIDAQLPAPLELDRAPPDVPASAPMCNPSPAYGPPAPLGAPQYH